MLGKWHAQWNVISVYKNIIAVNSMSGKALAEPNQSRANSFASLKPLFNDLSFVDMPICSDNRIPHVF